MRVKNFQAQLVIGAFAYSVLNLILVVIGIASLGIGFAGHATTQAYNLAAVGCWGALILVPTASVVAGWLVARACARKAGQLGQIVTWQLSALWGGFTTSFSPLVLRLIAVAYDLYLELHSNVDRG